MATRATVMCLIHGANAIEGCSVDGNHIIRETRLPMRLGAHI